MPKVHWILPDGQRISDEVGEGTNLMDAAQLNGIAGIAGNAAAACPAPPAMSRSMSPGAMPARRWARWKMRCWTSAPLPVSQAAG